MKIDNSLNSLGGVTSGPRTQTAGKSARAPQAEGQDSDVALSALSTKLQNVDSNPAGASVANTEKIAQIRAAIAQGNFTIDASKIADGLIDGVRQMLHAQG